MMLPNEYRSPLKIVKSDTSDEENQKTSNHFTPSRLNSSNPLHSSFMNENGICDLESSGVFVAGYTGPIHKWEHPGYQFLTESAQVSEGGNINVTLFSYTKAFGYGPLHFEPWSRDEDNT
ncbi:ras-related protein Rab-7L1 [Trichonephila clavipes]|nr:ras-related protein Rab-7L1 [Trichonephila clavipes]